MTGYEGFAQLGDMLTGGAQPDGLAYAEGALAGNRAKREGFAADKAFEEARISRSMAIARESIPEAMRTAGYAENMIPYLSAVQQSNRTINMGQLGQNERPGAAQLFADSEAAMRAGRLGEANALNAAGLGEAYEPYSAVGGGKAVLRGDTGEIDLTPMGIASQAAEAALAGSRDASADAARARAENTRNPPPKDAPKDAPAGARRAKDGKLYAPDPARPGKYLLVEE